MQPSSRKLRWLPAAIVAAVGLAALYGGLACQGHVIRAAYAPNHARDFDFRRPPCEGRPRSARAAPGEVWIRYLGASGLFIEWRGTALLTGPFFSNYDMGRVLLGPIRWDLEAIRLGMAGLPDVPVRAVIAGHSHYDHIGDLPPIVERWAPRSAVLVNRSGRNLLERCPELARASFIDPEAALGRWIGIEDEQGRPAPLRIMPLESGHAPQLRIWRFARGEVTEPWDCIDGRSIRELRQGRPLAFLIDLLAADGGTAFRIHYQDAAAERGLGLPPREVLEQRAVDLAVLCMPSSWNAEGYPQAILEGTRARHALVTHYEDFFRLADRPRGFVAGLTDRRANIFLDRVREEMGRPGHDPRAPASEVCGPASAGYTMPLPGEWLRFEAEP